MSFWSVAAAYERYRPGYPAGLVDEVLTYAGRPVHTALEIGAGTGKATRAFARRGIAVVEAAVHAARLPFSESDSVPSPDGTPAGSQTQWPATELAQSGLFTDLRQASIDRRRTVSARDYLGHLSTISAYLQLPSSVRAEAFGRILEVLPERVEVAADLVVHLARRAW